MRGGEASVHIDFAGGSSDVKLQFTTAPSIWVGLGTFRFEAGQAGGVTIKAERGCVVADMVKLVRKP